MSNNTQNATVSAPVPAIIAEVFAENKKRYIAALKAAGASRAVVEYDGCGDDGKIESTEVIDIPADSDAKVTILALKYVQSGSTHVRIAVDVEMPIEDALTELWEQVLEHYGHGDYENGEGGCGTLTYRVESDSVTLEHNERFVDSEEHTYAG